ncbi:LamG domain-containing protein [Paraflavitalea sp. CAU 1676]|uniref:LamG domain-containing protein n=1 Tax=Paraflavitalea sp. CAU 1676 TaxID=3032598 RepID=UPI0023DCC33F|nr:LamG domain-containing protein [Paraflavitalea sp. CAU 1676]MDF2189470.1 LamG domain-containing protein [Paraflavitalea sp. CAU 1676]
MKILKVLSGSILLYLLCFSTSTQLVSCQKDPLTDTLIVRDTVIIRDTLDCNCYDLTNGLVAWYNFNNGSLKDSSGNGNHIAFNNATKVPDRFGKPNGAYQFNGTNNYMEVLNSSSLNPTGAITLAAVFKIKGYYSGLCRGNIIMAKTMYGDKENGFYQMGFTDNSCATSEHLNKYKFYGNHGDFYSGKIGGARPDSIFTQTEQWYSVVYTQDNLISKLYINGALKDSRTIPYHSFTPHSGSLYFGKFPDQQYHYWFNGVIDDIKIYNRALCDGEVKQLNRSKD